MPARSRRSRLPSAAASPGPECSAAARPTSSSHATIKVTGTHIHRAQSPPGRDDAPLHDPGAADRGTYDAEQATFTAAAGEHKHYVATDHLEAPELRKLRCEGLLALTPRREPGFDRRRMSGVVFHMLSSLDELGSGAFTAVGDSREEAQRLFARTRAIVLERAASTTPGDSRGTARGRLASGRRALVTAA
jgi:hypothetical protein